MIKSADTQLYSFLEAFGDATIMLPTEAFTKMRDHVEHKSVIACVGRIIPSL